MSFIEDLLHAVHAPADRQRVRALLDAWRGKTLYLPLRDNVRRKLIAEALISSGMPRADVARALMRRFGVSRATSYRLVSSAEAQ